MKFMQMPVSLFDLVAVGAVAAGLFSGRRRGMSLELLDLIKWLAVLFGCSAAYRALGENIAISAHVSSLLTCYLIAYVGTGLLIVLFFALLKRLVGGKLVGSDIFGHSEYYLGMASGVLRYGCVLLASLAILNARYFSPAEIRTMASNQKEIYGSEMFPTLRSVQTTVFDESFTGPLIKKNLGFLLIKPTPPSNQALLKHTMPIFGGKIQAPGSAEIPGFPN
jgi:uncharacterized membrane protein required for colicin V production